MSDLVERSLVEMLRDKAVSNMHPTPRRALEMQAADRIEELERTLTKIVEIIQGGDGSDADVKELAAMILRQQRAAREEA